VPKGGRLLGVRFVGRDPRPHSEFLRPTEIALGPENPPYPSRHARAVIAGRMRPF